MSALVLGLAMWQATADCGPSFTAGMEAYQRKDLGQALISLRTAVQCNPQSAAAHLAIGAIHAERGNESEALSAFLQVLQIEPKNIAALRAASSLYLKNGLHTQAQPLLETLVQVDPKSAAAHADLAAVYAAGGRREEAEKEFRLALAVQEGYFPALAGLGNLLARAGDNEGALPLLRKAAQLQPKAYEGHFLLGSALNRMGEFAEAQKELEEASRLGGENEPQVFYQLARAWGGLGNAAERKAALAKFSELTKKEKDDAELQKKAAVLIDEARELLRTGDLEKAAARLELAREAKPGDATLLFRLAGLNFDLQRNDLAREYIQAAISISPATWLYHYLLGLVEQSANHMADAKASLEVAARLQPTEAPVFHSLGQVLLSLEERDAAIAAFETAVKLAPDNAAFRKDLDLSKRR